MKQRWGTLIRVALAIVAISGWLWAVILRDLTQRYTRGERPGQYPGLLDCDLLFDYGLVFAIAHNAGDDIETAENALANDADAIEIDVIMVDGRLYAAHATPPKLIGARLFRGPRLEDAWEVASRAEAVALDLKDASIAYEEAVVNFLAKRTHDQVILYSRHLDSLIRLRKRLPDAYIYLSVPDRETFDEAIANDDLVGQLDGYSMQQRFIDEEVMAAVRARGQQMIAWTVNDLSRVNELVRLGVDGIASDNLAILRVLGGRERSEPFLRRPGPN